MDDLYDEFGNYIGEADDSDGEDVAPSNIQQYLNGDAEEDEAPGGDDQAMEGLNEPEYSNAVVLHEDKQYYPTAQQVYGRDVETLVQEEDTQSLAQPIIAPVEKKKYTVQEEDLPNVFFKREFMTDLMNFPEQVRNVAIVGDLHHGKTALMDTLVMQTHDISDRLEKRQGKGRDEQLRYTDTNIYSINRGLSTKAAPMSLVLQGARGKSYLVNIIDTPGQVNYVDEVASAMRLVDGIVLVVDVIEGVQATTELIIRHAVLNDLPMVLVINKIDRLITELRLPTQDAYFKLKHTVEQVNTHIENTIPWKGESRRLSPEKGNVAFACADLQWSFTLFSFAQYYADFHPNVPLDTTEFGRRLWGDIYRTPGSGTFTRKPVNAKSKRTFVSFILEPIWKLFSHTISQGPEELKETLASLGISLKPKQLRQNARDLLRDVCQQYFGPATGFVEMLVKHIPTPVEGAKQKLDQYYTGPQDSKVAQSMLKCDQDGPLVIHITKLFASQDASSFQAFGRVLSGTAKTGDKVRVLGEGYSLDDDEDMEVASISDTWIAESRYNVPVSGVPAGNFVLLGGVDNSIVKTATIVAMKLPDNEDAYIFKPITHFFESVLKVAVEPVNPTELPKMLDGLRKINKSYPLALTKVEESGEHILLGTGELYMDNVLHDLRKIYANVDIKVSDPVTRFCETVVDTSSIQCYAMTPNKKNKITMIAEPLDDGIAKDIESGKVNIHDPVRVVGKFFQDNYDYDMLAARNIWAFGPEDQGPNILQNDTIPGEVDQTILRSVRDTIRQGFSWATREGPLCEEPIRNTKFRLTDIQLADQAIFRGGGQIIPTARRACYGSFMMASPRLMEPVYLASVIGTAEAVKVLGATLAHRRGHVVQDDPIPGTPLYTIKGLIPVIDSLGFETDLRMRAPGQVTVSLAFDHWAVVPGDPLDASQKLRPLDPATPLATARDFVLKTRRRKGLADDITVSKFLDPELLQSLKEGGILDPA